MNENVKKSVDENSRESSTPSFVNIVWFEHILQCNIQQVLKGSRK